MRQVDRAHTYIDLMTGTSTENPTEAPAISPLRDFSTAAGHCTGPYAIRSPPCDNRRTRAASGKNNPIIFEPTAGHNWDSSSITNYCKVENIYTCDALLRPRDHFNLSGEVLQRARNDGTQQRGQSAEYHCRAPMPPCTR